jgi:Aldehyde dehydrogenase family
VQVGSTRETRFHCCFSVIFHATPPHPDVSHRRLLFNHSFCSGVFDGKSWNANGEWSDAVAPATGEVMARVRMGTVQDLQRCTQAALDARADWAAIPAPRRGEIVRQIGNKFREVRE